ncbi:MAG: T9SS C-terminal target domain-containing protein [Calditrichaeota bacterium]|nr:MAG: T9SS C-terminal target domain-containing protein [Calditrichota bacterium]
MTQLRGILLLLGYGILGLLSTVAEAQSSSADKFTAAAFQAIARAEPEAPIVAWVFFTDKGDEIPAKLAAAQEGLSPHAYQRRKRNRKGAPLVDMYDLPVHPPYVQQVRRRVIRVRHKSRWLNAVSVEATPAQLRQVGRLPFVRRIDLVHRYRIDRPRPKPVSEHQPGKLSRTSLLDYGISFTQNSLINVPLLHERGLSGKGVIICMLDAGFNNLNHEALSHLNILATRDFANHDDNVSDEPGQLGNGNHGTWTLSALAGFAPGKLIGPAYGATFLLARTEITDSMGVDYERHVEEDNWVAGAEWADSLGADIISSSLGYLDGFTHGEFNYSWEDMDGNTTLVTRAADIAAGRGILVVNSAGNGGAAPPGRNTLIGPADGDSVLAVGAVDSTGNRAGFSSTGPTVDGRIKPDVMAMGRAVVCASAVNPNGYVRLSGTSLSCPLVAGAAALLLEQNPTATNMDIMEALKATASNADQPDGLMGYGIINAFRASLLLSQGETEIPDRPVLLPNYPNPFNLFTTIRFSLPESAEIELALYSPLGQKVALLRKGFQPAGIDAVVWSGAGHASGVYVVVLRVGSHLDARKILLVR